MSQNKNRQSMIALSCFFLSGVVALIYEVAWIRMAGLIFGTTMFALSTVTAIFFAGIAIGSWYFGKKSYLVNNSIKYYGLLEAGAAFLALLSLVTFIVVQYFNALLYPYIYDNFILLSLFRAFFLTITIFPVTLFLGGTFPMFSKYVSNSGSRFFSIYSIYAINTLGGVVGLFLAGFILIPKLGANITIAIAAFVGVIIAVVINKVNYKNQEIVPKKTVENVSKSYLSWCVFVIAGFSFVGMQIVWSRFLSLLINNTVYTYTITLIAILFGIVLGSFVATLIKTTSKRTYYLYGVIELIASILILVTLLAPQNFWAKSIASEYFGIKFIILGLLILPTSFMGGILFPLSINLLNIDNRNIGFSTGLASALNTVGGIVGALLVGFLLIPTFGIQVTIYTIVSLLLLSGTIAIILLSSRFKISLFIFPLITAISLSLLPQFLTTKIPQDYLGRDDKLIDFKEGIASNISLVKNSGVEILKIDRLWQGEKRKNREIMVAHIPMILHNNPKTVAVVGLGAGQTGSRFLMYGIDSLFCIDIESELPNLIKKWFDAKWLDDNRVQVVNDDGRNFLTNTDKKFDIISLEVGQTFRPFLASFYTEDFYQKISSRLNSGGIVSQFVPMASFNKQMFKSVIKSFIAVFPNSTLWYNTSELLLIGSNDATPKLTFDRLDLLQHNSQVKKDLEFKYWGVERHALNDWQIFSAGFLCGAEKLKKIAQGQKVYRDNPPILEYETARVGVIDEYIDYIISICDDPAVGFRDDIDSSLIEPIKYIREINLKNIIANRLLLYYQDIGNPKILEKALELNPQNMGVLSALINYYLKRNNKLEALKYINHYLKVDPKNFYMHNNAATIYYQNKNLTMAIFHYNQALAINPRVAKIHKNLGVVYMSVGEYELAKKHLSSAISLNPNFDEAKMFYGELMKIMDKKVFK